MAGVVRDSQVDLYTDPEVRNVTTANWTRAGMSGERVKQVSIPSKVRSAVVEPIEPLEKGPPPPKGFSQKARRHCQRRWCWYLLGLVISLAIFLPVLFLVIVPAIIQHIVNKSSLPIQSGAILGTSPNAVTFSLRTSLNIPGGFTVTLDPTTLYLYNNGTNPRVPYSSITLPKQKLKGNATISVENQVSQITDMDEWEKFLSNAMNSNKTTLSVFGNTTAHLGKLKTHITLDKHIEINGLDKLSGFKVNSARLVIPSEADGTNFLSNLTIPNHSIFALGLGNVTLNLMSGNLTVGMATIDNVVANPGNNTFPSRGQLFIDVLIKNLLSFLSSEGAAIRSGNLQLSASGNSTTYNGQHIGYIEDVLDKLVVTTEVPLLSLLQGTLGGLLNGTSLVPSSSSSSSSTSNLTGELGALLGKLNLTALAEGDEKNMLRRDV